MLINLRWRIACYIESKTQIFWPFLALFIVSSTIRFTDTSTILGFSVLTSLLLVFCIWMSVDDNAFVFKLLGFKIRRVIAKRYSTNPYQGIDGLCKTIGVTVFVKHYVLDDFFVVFQSQGDINLVSLQFKDDLRII